MSTTTEHTRTTIRIPTPLRAYTGGQAVVEVAGTTVGTALADLTTKHPALRPHLYDDGGALRSFVNIYVNDEDIRYLDKDKTTLSDRDELSIVPSIAGGSVRVFECSSTEENTRTLEH